jgi:phosphoglycolate phosphatase-like HAD superfamily hydrolase
MYEGWNDVFSFIRNNNLKVAIVSDTHETTIKTVVNHFNIPCDYIVGHQSVRGKKKPNSFPMFEAIRLLGEVPDNVLSFGDSYNDFKVATGAGIEHYACLWATKDAAALKENGGENFIEKPQQIIEVLRKS